MGDDTLTYLNSVIAGGTTSICDEAGYSLLAQLLDGDHFAIARFIVDRMNSDEVNFIDEDGKSPLQTVCFYGPEDLAETLIAKGATINKNCILSALRGRVMSEEFILRYFDFSEPTDDTDYFWYACNGGYIKLLQILLDANYPIPPNILNYSFDMSKEEMENICLQLLDRGVNPLEADNFGKVICLSLAIEAGFSRYALRLLEVNYNYSFYFNTGGLNMFGLRPPTLLYEALKRDMFDVAKKLILRGHPYDPEIDKLDLPVPVQRILSAAYPEYQHRQSLRLDEVQYLDQRTRDQITAFTLHSRNQLPSEIMEQIFQNL